VSDEEGETTIEDTDRIANSEHSVTTPRLLGARIPVRDFLLFIFFFCSDKTEKI
jgi:hypothetical protein